MGLINAFSIMFSNLKKDTNKRKYEGASRGRRTAMWNASNTSVNTEIAPALLDLRNRSRDLRRNNPYAARIFNTLVSNVVGNGITTQFVATSSKEKKIETLWKEWADTTDCDFEGRLNFSQIQELVCSSRYESGEVLIRFRYVNEKIPFKIQILEADFIASHIQSDNIFNGIELDAQGRVTHYHLFKNHPGNSSYGLRSDIDTVKIEASEILHIYKTFRPGQLRGVPELAPIIITLKDLDEFQDAELVRQKVAACFSAFVHDIDSSAASESLGTEDDYGVELGERLEPGLIEHLGPGKSVSFANPGTKEGYNDYMKSLLRSVAAAAGISYESLTGDYSEVNYSSARMGHLQMQRTVKAEQKNIMIAQFMGPVTKKFIEYLPVMGIKNSGVTARFVMPAAEMVDPTKEISGKIEGLRAGIYTLSDVVSSLGKDPKEHLQQIKIDNELIDSLNLILDSDPRKIQKNGSIHQKENSLDEKKETPTT